MQFSSTQFLFLFLPVTLLLYYLLPLRPVKNTFLFVASLVFYAFGEPVFVFAMILCIVINYLSALCIAPLVERGEPRAKWVLGCTVAADLSLLFFYKYLGLAADVVLIFIPKAFSPPQILLPIGISFFTFQAISYVVDVYRGEPAQTNPINVGLYIALFPQLIAGPIVRYHTIADQIQNRKESIGQFGDGVVRFILGFAKKILLANTFALVADKAFGPQANLGVVAAWIGLFAYAMQIYFDFSAYSDMAIGLGHMFGFTFLENFNYPYISTSVTSFWRRWHISLSSWFLDYVYIPLGGSRVSKPKLVRNLLIVWLLTGIWHGANFTFVLWGLFYFALLGTEKLTNFTAKLPVAVGWCYTFFSVCMAWVLFRSESVSHALWYYKTLFGLGDTPFITPNCLMGISVYKLFWVVGIVAATPLCKTLFAKLPPRAQSALSVAGAPVLMGLLLMCVTYLSKGVHNPFIYFNF